MITPSYQNINGTCVHIFIIMIIIQNISDVLKYSTQTPKDVICYK